jgi:influenza virus NS1A-binding protein
MNRPMPPPWMRAASGRRSPTMQKVYLRRRIVAALIPLAIIILLIVLLTGGGGGKGKSAVRTTTTTRPGPTTTVPLQLVVAAASWHLPIPLSRSVVLPVNTNLGVFGGLTTSGNSKTIYEIDPNSGIATAIGTMNTSVHDAAGAVIGSSYYVFGGSVTATTESAEVQEFSFSETNHLTGTNVSTLPAKRGELASVSVNGETYLVGGFDGKAWQPSVVGTTDGMTFTAAAQLSPAVRYAAVAALNGTLYVIGGELSPNAADATNVQQVNLQAGTVTALSPLPAGLSHAAAAVLNNNIYVFGGRSGGHAIATISELNTTTGQLSVVGQLPAARSNMGVALVGSTVYLLGGEDDANKPTNSVVTVRLVPQGSA